VVALEEDAAFVVAGGVGTTMALAAAADDDAGGLAGALVYAYNRRVISSVLRAYINRREEGLDQKEGNGNIHMVLRSWTMRDSVSFTSESVSSRKLADDGMLNLPKDLWSHHSNGKKKSNQVSSLNTT